MERSSVIYVINVIKVLDSHLVGKVLCNLCNKCNNSTRFSPGWRGPRFAESVSYFRASGSCTSCLLGPPPLASSRSPLMPNPTVYSSARLSPKTARSLHAVYELMVPSLLSPMMNKSHVYFIWNFLFKRFHTISSLNQFFMFYLCFLWMLFLYYQILIFTLFVEEKNNNNLWPVNYNSMNSRY